MREIRCPFCDSASSRFSYVRHHVTVMRRFRRCRDCGQMFETVQPYEKVSAIVHSENRLSFDELQNSLIANSGLPSILPADNSFKDHTQGE